MTGAEPLLWFFFLPPSSSSSGERRKQLLLTGVRCASKKLRCDGVFLTVVFSSSSAFWLNVYKKPAKYRLQLQSTVDSAGSQYCRRSLQQVTTTFFFCIHLVLLGPRHKSFAGGTLVHCQRILINIGISHEEDDEFPFYI